MITADELAEHSVVGVVDHYSRRVCVGQGTSWTFGTSISSLVMLLQIPV